MMSPCIGRACRWGVLSACSLVAALAHADFTLTTATPEVMAGQPVEVGLLVTNPGAEPLPIEIPSLFQVRIDTGHASAVVEFIPDESGAITVAPQGFRRVTLRGVMPLESAGSVTLTVTGINANPLLLAVSSPAVPAEAAPADVTSGTLAAASETELIDKPPVIGVSVYEPVYIIAGGDGGLNAKFQISLRYRMFDGNGAIASRLPWVDDLYFSYSQTSLWDLNDLSKPFRDSSYRPRLFYGNYDLLRVADGRVRLGIEGGFGHESNGKDGLESRSINIAYARPTFTFGHPDGRRLYVAPLISHYFEREENPDIADYRGNVDLLVGFGSRSSWDFWGTFRKGNRGNNGSVELNVSYPLSRLSGGDLTGWLLTQYFSGHGESLLDYNRKLDSQFRFGIAVAL